MDLVVCIKRTPDTTTKISVGPDARNIAPDGVQWIINPYDEYAIEEALRLKEKFGGTVAGISVDPDKNETILRKALAMGVDKAVLLHGGGNFDPWSIAVLLANQIKQMPHDLVLFGKQAIDDDNYQVPSIVAHLLGYPRINVVTKLQVEGRKVVAYRQIEGGEELVECDLPCIVSAQRGLNEPRYPSMKGIVEAKKKPLETKAADNIARGIDVVKLEPPAPRPPGRIVANVTGKTQDEIRAACREVLRLLKEEAKIL